MGELGEARRSALTSSLLGSFSLHDVILVTVNLHSCPGIRQHRPTISTVTRSKKHKKHQIHQIRH